MSSPMPRPPAAPRRRGVRCFLAALIGFISFLLPASPHAQESTEDRSSEAAPVLLGAGNVPISLSEEALDQRLDDVESLGLGAIRAQTGGGAYEGRPGLLAQAERLLAEAEERGIRVIFGVHRRPRGFVGDPSATDPEGARAAGAAWGRLAARFPSTAYGFSVQRELDHFPEDLVADGLRDRVIEVIFAFCEGVRAEAPEVVCLPGGLGYRPGELPKSGAVLRQLAPGIRSGLFAGLNLHYYRPCGYTLRDDVREKTMENIRELLAAADLPRDTPLFFTEVNVRSTSCASESERAEALARHLRTLAGLPTTQVILIHSPWLGEKFGVPPGTPAGDAILDVVSDVTSG